MTIEPTLGQDSALPTAPDPAAVTPGHETARIARAASVLALGNITSRVLGLVRETVKSHFFGAGSLVDAYGIATFVPTMLYDLLIGGMLNGALVPVFSELAEKDRDELWRLASAMLNLTVIGLAAFILIVELLTPQVTAFFLLLSGGGSADVVPIAARLLRITVLAVLFLSVSGVMSGLLYALKRFAFPAFTAAVFNASIVALTLFFHRQLDIAAMAVGLLIGSIMQVLLQLPGLRDTSVRIGLRFWHPDLRRVGLLYAPSLIPLGADMVSRWISYNLALQTGAGGISWMGYATYLTQLPQGLVATAVSLAVLPTLSAQAAQEIAGVPSERFKQTLAKGLRLVMVLIIPATIGLFILAGPTIDLIYEHGDFVAFDTLMTGWALRLYLLGLPFAAVDLLLVFAFYARQDTLTPALVGVGSIIIYLLLAAGLLPTWGLFSLMVADSVKHLLHTLLSSLLLWRRLGGLGKHGVLRTLLLVLAASAVMGAGTYAAWYGLEIILPAEGTVREVAAVGVPALVGIGLYLAMSTLFKLEETQLLWAMIRRRLPVSSL